MVGVLCSHMQHLAPREQHLLQFAAGAGYSFSMLLLQAITQLPLHDLVLSVCELEAQGMLLCIAHANELRLLTAEHITVPRSTDDVPLVADDIPAALQPDSAGSDTASEASSCSAGASGSPTNCASESEDATQARLSSIMLQFAHDKIRDAAYRLIPEEQVSKIHLLIA